MKESRIKIHINEDDLFKIKFKDSPYFNALKQSILHLIVVVLVMMSGLGTVLCQLPPYDLKALDLNTAPLDFDDVEQVASYGNNIYITLNGSKGTRLLVFDGDTLQTINENIGEIEFLGAFKNGFFLASGSRAGDGRALYFVDTLSHQRKLLHSSRFQTIHIFEDKAIFLARPGELYVTDGTQTGTQLIKKFEKSVDDKEETVLNYRVRDKLIFIAPNEINGTGPSLNGVWVTDGTIEGTTLLVEVSPDDLNSSYIYQPFLISNDSAFFGIQSSDYNRNGLWVTDGTLNGTLRLTTDEVQYVSGSNRSLVNTKNGVLFLGETETLGRELYITDGTVAGTKLLKDFASEEESGFVSGKSEEFISHEDMAIFKTADGKLWKSDGSLAGTQVFFDFAESPDYRNNKVLEFSYSTNEYILYTSSVRSDSSILWTVPLDLSNPPIALRKGRRNFLGNNSIFPSESLSYFKDGDQLFVTNGTKESTQLLGEYSSIKIKKVLHDKLYFTSRISGKEWMFVSDGTVSGTRIFRDVVLGGFEELTHFIERPSDNYFIAKDSLHGISLFEIQQDEVNLVTDLIDRTKDSSISELIEVGGMLYFEKDNYLWSSNGTIEGTQNLEVKISSLSSSIIGQINGKVLIAIDRNFFDMYSRLWITDGTKNGTQPLFTVSDNFLEASRATLFEDKLWFFFDDGENGYELWNTDGTLEGTQMAFESLEGNESIFSKNNYLVSNNDFIFFQNKDTNFGKEIWRSDGTREGTMILKDISNGPASISFGSMAVVDSMFLFDANSDLWISDGTEEGTKVLMPDVYPVYLPSGIQLGNRFIFNSYAGLWSTEGTVATTKVIAELGAWDLTQYNDKVMFTLNELGLDDQPWISDGTSEGTYIVKVVDSTGSSNIKDFTKLDDLMFFIGDKGPLWYTDGTGEGTNRLPFTYADLHRPEDLVAYDRKLFFIGESDTYGKEIHYLDFFQQPDIRGTVFHDENQNGKLDNTEQGIPNIKLIASNGKLNYTFSNSQGNFNFFLEEGNYTIYPQEAACWELTTDSVITDGNSSSLNFGFKKLSGPAHLDVRITAAPSRCGFTVPYWLSIYNSGCQPTSGKVVLELDELVTFLESDTILQQEGDQLVWYFSDLPSSSHMQIKLYLKMPSEEAVGTSIQQKANAFISDSEGNSNFATTSQLASTIRCAIDPNDKQVSPFRIDPNNNNYTTIEEELNYNIRFQNTGNDTAFTVRIIDTLSSLLDPQTFEPLGASHPYTIYIDTNGIVEFIFDNILLPDSTTNEVASHGFINFSIQPINGITDFNIVENEAGIYFDFNSPIITNRVKSTFVNSLDKDKDGFYFWEECDDNTASINPSVIDIPNNGIDEDCNGEDSFSTSIYEIEDLTISIFPNPVQDELQINWKGSAPLTSKIIDVNGRLQKEMILQAGNNTFNMKNISKGIYFLQIIHPEKKLMIVDKLIKY